MSHVSSPLPPPLDSYCCLALASRKNKTLPRHIQSIQIRVTGCRPLLSRTLFAFAWPRCNRGMSSTVWGLLMLLKAVQYASAKGSRAAFSFRGRNRISTAFSLPSQSEFFSTSSLTKRRCSSTSIFVKVASEVDEQFYEEKVSYSGSNFNNDVLVDEPIQHVQKQLQSHFNFPLDEWQLSAGAAILADQNVIVCAATGYVLLFVN